jgi:hypothetical protein
MLHTLEELLEKIILYTCQPLLLNHYTLQVSRRACRVFFRCLKYEDLSQIPKKFLVSTVLQYQETNSESDKLRLCLEAYVEWQNRCEEYANQIEDEPVWENYQIELNYLFQVEKLILVVGSVISLDWDEWFKESYQPRLKQRVIVVLRNPRVDWRPVASLALRIACGLSYIEEECFRRVFKAVDPDPTEIKQAISKTFSVNILKVLVPLVDRKTFIEIVSYRDCEFPL